MTLDSNLLSMLHKLEVVYLSPSNPEIPTSELEFLPSITDIIESLETNPDYTLPEKIKFSTNWTNLNKLKFQIQNYSFLIGSLNR
jgi:hypothetical protein